MDQPITTVSLVIPHFTSSHLRRLVLLIVDVNYMPMMLPELVSLVITLVNVVKMELSPINVHLAQMEPISIMELVVLAQLELSLMMLQMNETHVIPLVLNVKELPIKIAQNVMYQMDSIY
jgi:hypothetical protein